MRRATRQAIAAREQAPGRYVVPSLDHCLIRLVGAHAPIAAILSAGPPFTKERWSAVSEALLETAVVAIEYLDAFGVPAETADAELARMLDG